MSGSLNLSMEAQRSAGLNGLAPAVLDVPTGGVLPFADDVLRYRYLPGAALRNRAQTLNLHVGTTLQGSVRWWAWNVTGTYYRIRSSAFADVGVPLDPLQSSIDAGGDPLTPIDPAEAALRISDDSQTVIGTFATKAVANGPLIRLPAGDAMMTITADYVRSTSRGTQPGIGDPALMFARTIKGGNVSVTIPIAAPDQGKLSFMGRMTANASAGVSDVSKYGRLTSVS